MTSDRGYSVFFQSNVAGELKIPIWTASQVNRSGANNDIISLESISESFAKAAVSDVIITLSRKMEDRMKNTGRLFVAKNRAGKDGVVTIWSN
jgi:replicative DNA helicase